MELTIIDATRNKTLIDLKFDVEYRIPQQIDLIKSTLKRNIEILKSFNKKTLYIMTYKCKTTGYTTIKSKRGEVILNKINKCLAKSQKSHINYGDSNSKRSKSYTGKHCYTGEKIRS
jgi:hypothetical protein